MSDITQVELKKILYFDEKTGDFTWVNDCVNKVKSGDVAGCNKDGYIVIRVNGHLYRAHRLAWLYVHGDFPSGSIDHINHKKNDNRIENLRCVSHKENCRNQSKNKRNKSGYTGVHFRKDIKKWMANIMVNGKTKTLGHFDEINDAIRARKEAESKYNFHNNHGVTT